jgi:hypothetical protein
MRRSSGAAHFSVSPSRYRVDPETAQGPAGESEERCGAEDLRGDDRHEKHARKTQNQSGDQPRELCGGDTRGGGDRDGYGTLGADLAHDQPRAGGPRPH